MTQTAQGTIEYLIGMAIVIVIGLIVVGISTNLFDTQQITQTNEQLKGQIGTGGISIIGAITNTTNDTGLLNFKNNISETFTLTKITIEDKDNEYNNLISPGNNELIQLTNTCKCEPTQKTRTCEFEITYKTKHDLIKKITQKIIVQCEENSEPTKEPILPKNCFNTKNDIIQICSLQDLNKIREQLDRNYILMKDIDASETINWNDRLGWEPLGSCGPNNECDNEENDFTYTFNGQFNGNEKIIKNLYINRPSGTDVGFIGYASMANISNLKIIDTNITGLEYIGGIIGYTYQSTIKNVHTTGTINGTDHVGGLIGFAYESNIIRAHTSGDINGDYIVGGLIGYTYDSTVTDAYSTGKVTGNNTTGGLIGWSLYSNITNTYTTGEIIGTDYTGGLIGSSSGIYEVPHTLLGIIKNSYSAGKVTGTTNVGGLIGEANNNSNMFNCYWDVNTTNQNECCGDEICTGCNEKNGAVLEPNAFLPKTELSKDYNVPMQNNTDPNNNWDFENTWKKIPGNYPQLK